MTKQTLFVLLMIVATLSNDLYQIQKTFLENYSKISHLTFSEQSQQKSLDAQLAEFSQLLQKQQYKNFKADPELSAQILLKKGNNWNQSIYLNAKQQAQLLIEVKVTHKQDIGQFENQSIQVHLISFGQSTVIYSCKVSHLKIIQARVEPGLYEIRVSFKWESTEAATHKTQQIQKHIKIDADLAPLKKAEQTVEIADEKKANERLKQIKTRTDKIFVDSLQIWEQVQNHHQEQFLNQEGISMRAYIEIIGVLIVNVIELMALKKTLKVQSLI